MESLNLKMIATQPKYIKEFANRRLTILFMLKLAIKANGVS